MTDKLMQAVERAKSGFFGTGEMESLAHSCDLAANAHYATQNQATGDLLTAASTALRASLARIDAMQETLGRLASPVPFCDARAASENPRIELETRMAVARAALEAQP